MCDSIQPGGKPVAILKRAQFPVRLHKAILAKIHGFIPVSHHPQDEVINRLFPLVDKDIERFRVTVENALDDFPVIGLHKSKTLLSAEKTDFTCKS